MNNFICRQKDQQNRFVLHRNETHNISYIIFTNLTVVIIRKAIEKKPKYTFSCKRLSKILSSFESTEIIVFLCFSD